MLVDSSHEELVKLEARGASILLGTSRSTKAQDPQGPNDILTFHLRYSLDFQPEELEFCQVPSGIEHQPKTLIRF